MSTRSRVLFILKYLNRYTDDYHRVTIQDVQAAAEEAGISVIYKTFREDLEELRSIGFDIQTRKEAHYKQYFMNRSITVKDRKAMIRAVKKSIDLTPQQKERLINKLLDYGSVYEKEVLQDAIDK